MKKLIYVAVAVLLIGLVGFWARDSYGDRMYERRCVEHHADFCNFDGDGDDPGSRPWWAKGRECEPQKDADDPYYYEACLRQAKD